MAYTPPTTPTIPLSIVTAPSYVPPTSPHIDLNFVVFIGAPGAVASQLFFLLF